MNKTIQINPDLFKFGSTRKRTTEPKNLSLSLSIQSSNVCTYIGSVDGCSRPRFPPIIVAVYSSVSVIVASFRISEKHNQFFIKNKYV